MDSSWGKVLGDFIQGLYWLIFIMGSIIIFLVGLVIWLVVK
jgi:hypothetical protein